MISLWDTKHPSSGKQVSLYKYYIISENPCNTNPCSNGGVCVVGGNDNAGCECIDYWSGPICEDIGRYRSILCCIEMA